MQTDPAPGGALKAFNQGQYLIDTTGHGYLRKFIKLHGLQVDYLSPVATAQMLGEEIEPHAIIAVKKKTTP